MTDTTGLPNLTVLPNLAQLEAFVMNADAVLAPFASIPQVAFVHQIIVPLLEGALTIGTQVQAQAGSQTLAGTGEARRRVPARVLTLPIARLPLRL